MSATPADRRDEDDDLVCAPAYFNPYADEEALGIERDRWDRPLIKPDPEWRLRAERGARWLEGASSSINDENRARGIRAMIKKVEASNGWPDGEVTKYQMADGRRPYARVSTLAPGVDPGYGLGIWQRRHALLAVAHRPDLIAALQTMTYADAKDIDAIMDEALIRAKDDDAHLEPAGTTKLLRSVLVNKLQAALRGTVFHRLTTPGMAASELARLIVHGTYLDDHRIGAESLAEALEENDLEIVDSEQFVVNDDLCAAGSYDHLYRDRRTGKVHVGDKKTGRLEWLSHVVQVEGYSGARNYDPATGERWPLHEDLDPSMGLILHTDLVTGRTTVYELELDGRTAQLAVDVWKANKSESIKSKYRKRA